MIPRECFTASFIVQSAFRESQMQGSAEPRKVWPIRECEAPAEPHWRGIHVPVPEVRGSRRAALAWHSCSRSRSARLPPSRAGVAFMFPFRECEAPAEPRLAWHSCSRSGSARLPPSRAGVAFMFPFRECEAPAEPRWRGIHVPVPGAEPRWRGIHVPVPEVRGSRRAAPAFARHPLTFRDSLIQIQNRPRQ